MSVLCLHILQAAMVYVNTLMVQDVLAEDEWSQLLTSEDYRGLTPLTWAHVAICGTFRLEMDKRLDLPLSAVVPGQRRAADDAARAAG
jgi:hypothetical protein